MQPANKIWYLISRSLSGETSAEEEALLMEALQQNPALQHQYTILKASWNSMQKDETGSSEPAAGNKISRILQLAAVQQLLPGDGGRSDAFYRRRRRRKMAVKIIMYAGVTIIAVTGTWVFVRNKPQGSVPAGRQMQQVATQNGTRTSTRLPDGTMVWLNAGSKIFYENDFAGATREVKLEGEAYFDVVKNPGRPFIVHTGGINIKVLGTVFNVRSYPADKTVETTLIRGLVQVTRNGYPQQKPVYVHPNEKLVVDKVAESENDDNTATRQQVVTTGTYKLAQLDTTVNETERVETAWVYNRLEFRGEDFEQLARKMERWYNVSIVFEDDNVKKQTYNGSFENETVEQALTALKAAAPFSFSIQGHLIKIKSLK